MDSANVQFKDGRIHMTAEEEPPTYQAGPNGRTKGAQLEDGFGRVANELAEKFSGARLSGPEHDILWLVVRFTYGWNRKKARITGAQMKHFTGRNIPRCSSILNGLIQKRILYREGGKFGEIGINTKDWEWIKPPSARSENLPKGGKLPRDSNLPKGGKLEPDNLPKGGKLNLPKGGNHIKKGKYNKRTKENNIGSSGDNPSEKEFSDLFEQAWKIYPSREGGNSKKEAFKAWQARIKQGVQESDLIAGLKRYAIYCDKTNKTGTGYVKQAKSFFGPAEHWKESWECSKNNKGNGADKSGTPFYTGGL